MWQRERADQAGCGGDDNVARMLAQSLDLLGLFLDLLHSASPLLDLLDLLDFFLYLLASASPLSASSHYSPCSSCCTATACMQTALPLKKGPVHLEYNADAAVL